MACGHEGKLQDFMYNIIPNCYKHISRYVDVDPKKGWRQGIKILGANFPVSWDKEEFYFTLYIFSSKSDIMIECASLLWTLKSKSLKN